MKRYKYQQIASKILKTRVLLNSDLVAPHIPETKWYHLETLQEMLGKYSNVYIKPDKGTGGGGIIRISHINREWLKYQEASFKKKMNHQQLFAFLKKRITQPKKYLIQKGIALAQIHGRPFDIRVLLQKPRNQWLITGSGAKIAAPGKIVTNYCKGGRPFDVYRAIYISSGENHEKAKKKYVELYYLSKEIAKILHRRFVGLKELGIDMGIDRQHKFWIFEVNTRPNFKMFKKLGDGEMYQIIQNVHRQIV